MSISIDSIRSKITNKERLSDDDGLWLFEKADLVSLGALANEVNLSKNGLAVFYNVNRHINPTNICSLSCKFCAYSKKLGDEGGYAYEIPEMIGKARAAIEQGATELHIVGGLHPRWPYGRYIDMIAALRKEFPEVHLKGFTAVELDWMARKARKSIKDVMIELRDVGLNSFPGGGAEIFHEEIRDQICETKVSGDDWIAIHRTAHSIGMRSNCTMLYGHIESYWHRVDHMRRLRALQDETNGFNVFIPLAFQPHQNEMGITHYTFGEDDLRTIAVARLYLDNFKHIKSYWVMLGQDVAQLALNFGANDIDGTVIEEKISRAAGGRSGMIMTRSNLETIIRRSGRIPIERTTLYEPVNHGDRHHLRPLTPLPTYFIDGVTLTERLKNRDQFTESEISIMAHSAPVMHVASCLDSGSQTQVMAQVMEQSLDVTDILQSHYMTKQPFIKPVETLEAFKSILLSRSSELASGQIDHVQMIVDLARVNDATALFDPLAGQDKRLNSLVATGLRTIHNWDMEVLSALLRNMRSAGVMRLDESLEDALTMSWEQRRLLSRMGLNYDMQYRFALPIAAQQSTPDWTSFSHHVSQLKSHQIEYRCPMTVKILTVQVHDDDAARVMPLDYFKALSIARIVLGPEAVLYCPIPGIASLAPERGLGAKETDHAAMKMMSLVKAFGGSGVGPINIVKIDSRAVAQDLMASKSRVALITHGGGLWDLDLNNDGIHQAQIHPVLAKIGSYSLGMNHLH
jgi:aminodeoxyfutalosine synthase